MKRQTFGCWSSAIAAVACTPAWSQTTPAPLPAPAPTQVQGAPAGGEQSPLPEVQVIQKDAKPEPEPAAEPKPKIKKKKPDEAQAVNPKAVVETAGPATIEEPESAAGETSEETNNPAYGAVNSQGAAARAINSAQAPINSRHIVPSNLEGFSSAASIIDGRQLDEAQPRQIQDVFNRVPGVHVINDDGLGRHGGVGMRGSPPAAAVRF